MAVEPEVDEVEAKRLRKAAKRAAKDAASLVAAEEEVPVSEKKAKKEKKTSKAEVEDALATEIAAEADEAEAKRQRKAAKKAAKEAAAQGDVTETPKAKKQKRGADESAEAEAPEAKRSKKPEAAGEEATEGDKNALKVFIKGLPYSASAATVHKDFTECGEIVEFKMPVDDYGSPKGFAFIKYATEEGFAAAMKFNNTDYGGRYLNVSKAADIEDRAKKGKTREGDWTCPSCSELVFASKSNCRKCGTVKPGGGADNDMTVFIRGLPWAITEESLRKDFSACGEIERLSFPKNEEGKSKGISFIKYTSQEGIDAALKFDNTEYAGRTIFVTVAGEVPKGKEGKDKGKGKGKEGKGKEGKDGKSKGKGKEAKSTFVPTAAFANKTGCIVEGMGDKKTFADSDDE